MRISLLPGGILRSGRQRGSATRPGVVAVLATAAVALSVPAASHAAAASAAPYPCSQVLPTVVEGANGDAGVIGWEANQTPVVACLGGSFYVRNGINATYGYGIYNDTATQWTNAGGYLPALVTSFKADGADVSITNFGDRVDVGGSPFVLVYSRVQVRNPTRQAVDLPPQPSAGLVALNDAPDTVPAGRTVDHDYVVAADQFGAGNPWPAAAALAAAGSYDQHFAHMRSFWNRQLSQIATVSLPDPQLDDAYKTGFIYTQIIRSGDKLYAGANNYQEEYPHDVIGILANLINQGDFSDAPALLEEAAHAVTDGVEGQLDGLWTLSWPWALYLEKTGNLALVKANFDTPGPLGDAAEPSIEDAAHTIPADETGPGGTMAGDDVAENYEALTGLIAYQYLAERVGDATEAAWAKDQYDTLLAAVNTELGTTISTYGLDYLPCDITMPNSMDACADPTQWGWAEPFLFGRWAWDGYLLGGDITGPGASLIDATYRNGIHLQQGLLPAGDLGSNITGAQPWSSAYDAGLGEWGLASDDYRDQGILDYEFMIAEDQSGPYSWWEGSSPPSTTTPWTGAHPASGVGASPHPWGMANANLVLLGSLAAQRADGSLVVGRGVPDTWLAGGKPVSVSNFPTTDGKRTGLTITGTAGGTAATLKLTGDKPSGPVLFELPAFVGNIARASAGTVDEATGTVTVPAGTRQVTVQLRHAPSPAVSLTLSSGFDTELSPGQSTTVTGTLANSGPGTVGAASVTLSAPAGWQVTPAGPVAPGRIPAGSSGTATWTVTAPASASGPVTAGLTATARYRDPATGTWRTVSDQQSPAPDVPVISGTSAQTASAGQQVTITGSGFGATKGTSFVEFTDGTTNWGCAKCGAIWQIDSWSDTEITFTVPIPSGTGGEWHVTPGDTAVVAVHTATGEAVTSLTIGTLQAPAPVITGISPEPASAGQQVTITGSGFGATQGGGIVEFTDSTTTWGLPVDSATWQIDSWSDTAVTFTVPEPSGTNGVWHVFPGTTAAVTVYTAAGAASTSLAITS